MELLSKSVGNFLKYLFQVHLFLDTFAESILDVKIKHCITINIS